MKTLRMRWEFHEASNDEARLHVDDSLFNSEQDDETVRMMRRLLNRMKESLPDDFDFDGTSGFMDDLTGPQKEFLDALASIRGIKRLRVQPYEIAVKRSLVFDWDELLPPIQRLVQDFVGAAAVEIREPFRCPCNLDSH